MKKAKILLLLLPFFLISCGAHKQSKAVTAQYSSNQSKAQPRVLAEVEDSKKKKKKSLKT